MWINIFSYRKFITIFTLNYKKNINLVAFAAFREAISGEVFALFVIAVAAAEVGVGLAMVLFLYRNRRNIDLAGIDSMKG